MNFSEIYRSLNDPIIPSAALVEKTLKRPRALPLRRLAALAAAAALAVRTELGYEMLYAVSPAAAQFFQPVRRSCEDSGVTMEVLSVRVDGSKAQAYIALSGEAVDGTCDLFDSWSFHLPFDQTGHCEQVGYNEETRTALFLCTTETMDGSPIPQGGKMTFSAGCFLSGKESLEEQAVDLDLTAFAGEAVTVPVGPGREYFCSGGSYSAENPVLPDNAPLLRPGAALAEPLPGLSITAAGYAGGLFHIQLCRGNATELDNHGWLWLEEDGTRLNCVYSAAFSNLAAGENRVDYDQYAFDVSPDALDRYTLHGNFTTASSLTEGRWQVTFPLENTEP